MLVIRGFVEPAWQSSKIAGSWQGAALRGTRRRRFRPQGAMGFAGETRRQILHPAPAACDHSIFWPLDVVAWRPANEAGFFPDNRDAGGARVTAGTPVRGVCLRRASDSGLRTNTLPNPFGLPDRALSRACQTSRQGERRRPPLLTGSLSVPGPLSSSCRNQLQAVCAQRNGLRMFTPRRRSANEKGGPYARLSAASCKPFAWRRTHCVRSWLRRRPARSPL